MIVPKVAIASSGVKVSDGSEGADVKHSFPNILELVEDYGGYENRSSSWLGFADFCTDWNPRANLKESGWEWTYNLLVLLDATIFGKCYEPPNLKGGRKTNWKLRANLNQKELDGLLLGILTIKEKWDYQFDIENGAEKDDTDDRPAPEWIVEKMLKLTADNPQKRVPIYDQYGKLYWPKETTRQERRKE